MALRNCIFCGSDQVFIHECENTGEGFSTFWVECEDCASRGPISEYKNGAEGWWNGDWNETDAVTGPPENYTEELRRAAVGVFSDETTPPTETSVTSS